MLCTVQIVAMEPLLERRENYEIFAEKKECCICLLEMKNDDEVATTQCGHTFHNCCLELNKEYGSQPKLCPLCRTDITIDQAMMNECTKSCSSDNKTDNTKKCVEKCVEFKTACKENCLLEDNNAQCNICVKAIATTWKGNATNLADIGGDPMWLFPDSLHYAQDPQDHDFWIDNLFGSCAASCLKWDLDRKTPPTESQIAANAFWKKVHDALEQQIVEPY